MAFPRLSDIQPCHGSIELKKIALILLFAIACRPQAGMPVTGAPTARAAVEQFLAAVRAQDLQAMSAIWGNEKGPAREQYPLNEVEQRELLMQCYFSHDSFRILGQVDGENARKVFTVELKKGALTRTTTFSVVEGPRNRWYLDNGNIEPVKDFCRPNRNAR